MDNLAIANNEYFIRLNNFDKARNTEKCRNRQYIIAIYKLKKEINKL
ncbi:hypothetical protein JPFTNV_10680 [Francisella tularensis subsp. holarctica]|nr:hypothetical protein JPFTNV_10680 [Francisella tularensis subsp. holarctica]BCL54962.1 hypothetical protein JPFTKU_07760 [Francisella tularensis subsp. holarctica]